MQIMKIDLLLSSVTVKVLNTKCSDKVRRNSESNSVVSDLAMITDLSEGFCDYPRYLQANSMVVP
jgi:hypothetical protein